MAKPATFDGYCDQYTVDCERVLITLLLSSKIAAQYPGPPMRPYAVLARCWR